ncbi:uncharacterized protein I206_102973 [Kwoniella pini CBS 10737]|uniref:F-box domain-containing protein n=1 Tax=Kwoniella pini CBS 10737 TaxID=1296096 RepID=A0A1B9I6Y6_9TREE|nr:uncharacterized protein I206_03326 [Kwoniella pini CBS 10737]OCF51259.1 hypothetical protein I206_03326 [Kwoniella pini CBS 10737]
MPVAIPSSFEVNSLAVKNLTLSPRLSDETLPIDIIRRISSHLADDGLLETVSNIQRCSKEVYLAVTPILYRCLEIKNKKSDLLFTVDSGSIAQQQDGSHKKKSCERESNSSRRLAALKHVRKLIIHHIPSDAISESFFKTVRSFQGESQQPIVLPKLRSVEILPNAVEQLRTWVSSSNSSTFDQNPIFLDTISQTSKINTLCITFKSVLSEHWEEYRDLTLIGQYQLLSRINSLCSSNNNNSNSLWSNSLKTLNVHNISHQLLPTLPFIENNYFFQSHIIGSNLNPIIIPTKNGKETCYLGGIDWNYRSWQIGKSIKYLFPSSLDLNKSKIKEIINLTKWNFINSKGQIKTKLIRDEDDDENGIPYKEVINTIKNQIRIGIPQELPIWQGWNDEQIENLFEKIKYFENGECENCDKSTDSIPTISSIHDIS